MTGFVNLSSNTADSVMDEVRAKLDNDYPVSGTKGPTGAIQCLLQRDELDDDGSFALDLIGHSRGSVLQLGDWSLDDATLAEAVADALATRGTRLSAVRLLGCETAVGAAWGVLGLLYRVLRERGVLVTDTVQGTTLPIVSDDFSPKRFTSTTVLDTYVPPPPPPPGPAVPNPKVPRDDAAIDDVRSAWVARFLAFHPDVRLDLRTAVAAMRIEPPARALRDYRAFRPDLRWPVHFVDAESLQEFLEHCGPDLAPAPGLLAVPDREFFAFRKAPDGRRGVVRASIMLRGALARIYSASARQDLVIRIPTSQRMALRTLIADSLTR